MTNRGFIVWFTGLPGSGKTTTANLLVRRLSGSLSLQLLDGDELRTWLSKDLGFAPHDRSENARRVGRLARILAGHGVGVLVALVSPYAADRAEQRRLANEEGLPFCEVHVTAPLQELIRRDTKGLYERALKGDLKEFTGVSAPYQPPEAPDLTLDTSEQAVITGVERIESWLQRCVWRPDVRLVSDEGREVRHPTWRKESRR